MEKQTKKNLLGSCLFFLALFGFQVFAGKLGSYFAAMLSYKQIDPYNKFASVSVHHFVQMLLTLVVIGVLSKLLKINFNFGFGDKKTGLKYLSVFTGSFLIIAVIMYAFTHITKQIPVYDFPLNRNNVAGTLGFQLFLSGPSEEILFRALPVTMFLYIFGKSIKVHKLITLEVILASLLFSIAHIKWSLAPFTVQADYFQLVYAFALGTVQGVTYQKSRSIIYPILMHSFSNVIMVGSGYLFTLL